MGSTTQLYDVVSGFDERKKGLVKAIGFEGILYFPRLSTVNRKFELWIMSRVDLPSQSLVINDSRKIQFNKDDVGRVFGIPSHGLSVDRHGGKAKRETVSAVRAKYCPSIKAAQEVIERDYGGSMSPSEENAYKVAFVVFVMSTLLSPGASTEYWNALVDPSVIHTYDWSEYVIQRLMYAVLKLKSDLNIYQKVTSITGCTLFLQVLYLDSIDLCVWNKDHNILPRIRQFNYGTMKTMILCDSCSESEFGKRKLRAPSGLCYHWAAVQDSNGNGQPISRQMALCEAATTPAHALRVPVPSSASEPSDVQTASETSVNCSSKRHLCSDMKGVSLVDQPDPVGKKGRFSYCTEHKGHQDSASCQAPSNRQNLMPSSTIDLSKQTDPVFSNTLGTHCMITRMMPTLYLGAHHSKLRGCTDLNVTLQSLDSSNDYTPRKVAPLIIDSKTPWQLGFQRNDIYLNGLRSSIMKKLELLDVNNRMPCFIHYIPKYIEVSPVAVKLQFIGKEEMEMDLFDVILRHFKQLDDALYVRQSFARWRHFVESDFLKSILAGSFDTMNPSIREQFVGQHIGYDVPYCKMLFFPGLVEHGWVCYVWSSADNEIIIFDPNVRCAAPAFHARVVKLLKSALREVASKLFDGWEQDWESAKSRLKLTDSTIPCPNRTGIMCAHFCRNFDGKSTIVRHHNGGTEQTAGMLLAEVVKLSDNYGNIPEALQWEGPEDR
ncbi:unnamed protein product [Urochloa decumbens]|uniref:Ubiquitin-like protease family profile domain-containing protein n=1 Tax=Urochloa decumbens TaxID=240449 RepID=A0ABC8ZRS5_9POAL